MTGPQQSTKWRWRNPENKSTADVLRSMRHLNDRTHPNNFWTERPSYRYSPQICRSLMTTETSTASTATASKQPFKAAKTWFWNIIVLEALAEYGRRILWVTQELDAGYWGHRVQLLEWAVNLNGFRWLGRVPRVSTKRQPRSTLLFASARAGSVSYVGVDQIPPKQ